MENDDDDEVIKEFDVMLNRDITGSVHLFQHLQKTSPVRNAAKYRVKRENRLFEIEINQDDLKGKQDAIGGSKFGGRNDRLLLQSMTVKPTLSYAVGLINAASSEVHLAPVESVVQFRPNFSYLNNSTDSSSKQTATDADDAGTSSQSDTEAGEEMARPVTVRFAGAHEDKIKQARERSFTTFQQRQAEEEWADVRYHSAKSEESVQAKASLLCRSEQNARPLVEVPLLPGSPSKTGPPPPTTKRPIETEPRPITNVQDFLEAISCEPPASNCTM